MSKNERTLQLIYDAIDDVNAALEEGEKINKAPETALFGESGSLDSLGFVNLIVAVEQKMEEKFGTTIAIADERAMSRKRSPSRTVGSLAEYISSLLEEAETKPQE